MGTITLLEMILAKACREDREAGCSVLGQQQRIYSGRDIALGSWREEFGSTSAPERLFPQVCEVRCHKVLSFRRI